MQFFYWKAAQFIKRSKNNFTKIPETSELLHLWKKHLAADKLLLLFVIFFEQFVIKSEF